MANTQTDQQTQQRESWWYRLQRGQALVEYWPTLPAAVMVMISAAAVVGPIQDSFQKTADSLNRVVCEAPAQPGSSSPTGTDLDGGHHIEVVSSSYANDETTVVFRVSSGDKPAISHWVLGIDEETADKIVYFSEPYEAIFGKKVDPRTGKQGIKFDTGYGGGSKSVSAPPVLMLGYAPLLSARNQAVLRAAYAPRYVEYTEVREIVLTFAGRVDFVETLEVTTKAGRDQVSTGMLTVPSPSIVAVEEDC